MRLEAGDLVILDWCLKDVVGLVIGTCFIDKASGFRTTLVRVLRAGGRISMVDQVTGVARVLARACDAGCMVKYKSKEA